MSNNNTDKKQTRKPRKPSPATAIESCIRALDKLTDDERGRAIRCVMAYYAEPAVKRLEQPKPHATA